MVKNGAFLAKVINRLQRLSIETPFASALHDYVMRNGTIVWDDARALFWTKHPQDGWQVAVWMMPVALKFEPAGGL